MSREIEEFETRVQKVEEFIRDDQLVLLCNLVVYQLSGSMSVVRDLNAKSKENKAKGSSAGGPEKQVFRQHQ